MLNIEFSVYCDLIVMSMNERVLFKYHAFPPWSKGGQRCGTTFNM